MPPTHSFPLLLLFFPFNFIFTGPSHSPVIIRPLESVPVIGRGVGGDSDTKGVGAMPSIIEEETKNGTVFY